MDELFGHRRRRSNYHYQHNTSISMLAFESYSQSTEHSVRGRSQFTHQLDSSSSLQGDGGPNDSLNTTEFSGAKSPSTASRFLSNMRRSLSYSGPSKKREATIAQRGMHSTPEESLPPSPSSYILSNTEDYRPSIEQIAMGLHISRTPHLSPLSPQHRHHHSASPSSASSAVSRSNRRQTFDYPALPLSAPPMRRTSLQHRRRDSAPPIALPPPPIRSSMKKTSLPTSPSPSPAPQSLPPRSAASSPLTASASDLSLSTLPSSAPSTPRSARSSSLSLFSTKLHFRMARLLSGGVGGGGSSGKRSTESPVSTLLTSASEDDDSTNCSSELTTPRKVVRFDDVGHEDEDEEREREP